MNRVTTLEISEITIFGRIINHSELSPEMARYFLTLKFGEDDAKRMQDLASRSQDGALKKNEKAELVGYSKAACLLGILQSKARKTLKSAKV